MSAHRRVSWRVSGWRVESGSRRSCGRVLVSSNTAMSAIELAGVSSRRWAHCGRFSGERARGREWTRPLRPGRRRGGHACAGSWRAGLGATYGRQMSLMSCRRSATSTSSTLNQAHDHRLTEQLWRWITSKPRRVRRWRSWQSWRTRWVLQHCQLGQDPDRPGLRDMNLPKSIEQTSHART